MKRSYISLTIVFLLLFSVFVPIVPVRAASDPYPGIVPSVSYPSEIPLGDTATITVKGKNYGGESPEAYLSISFPDNPSKLWISSSDAQNSYIAWPDDQIWGGYGQYQLKAKYPLAEAMEAPWSSGLQRYLTVKVVPKLAGTFTFYVKMTAKDNDQNRWLADPSTDGSESSYRDQQDEYVYKYTILVTKNPTLGSNSYISPTTVDRGQSFTAYYYITNPNSYAVNVGLGCSIRPSGTSGDGIHDQAHDVIVSVSPGSDRYSRVFTVSSSASPGPYEWILAIWSGAPGSSTKYADTGWRSGLTVDGSGVVQITVKYPDGGAVTPDTLILYYSNWNEKTRANPSSNTYTFSGIESGTYHVEAYKDDIFIGSAENIQVSGGQTASRTITTTYKGNVIIYAYYRDGSTPLPGAEVKLRSHEGNVIRTGQTDSSGKVSFSGLWPNTKSNEYYYVHVYYGGTVGGITRLNIIGQQTLTYYVTTTVSLTADADILWASTDKPSYRRGETVYISVRIKNTGDTTLNYLLIRASITAPNGVEAMSLKTIESGISLSPGEEKTLSNLQLWTVTSGSVDGVYQVNLVLTDMSAQRVYDSKTSIVSFTVSPSSEKISTNLTVNLNPASITENTLTAVTINGRLTRTDTGAGIVGKTVSLSYSGGSIGTTTTGSNGYYTYEWKNIYLDKGSYTIAASFAGDDTYKASSNTATLTVRAGIPPTYAVNVKILDLPSSSSTVIYVDGPSSGSIEGGESTSFQFAQGTTHEIKVEEYVYVSDDTRYHCPTCSFKVSSEAVITFTYKREYRVVVRTNPFGTVESDEWYEEGSSVSLTAEPTKTGSPIFVFAGFAVATGPFIIVTVATLVTVSTVYVGYVYGPTIIDKIYIAKESLGVQAQNFLGAIDPWMRDEWLKELLRETMERTIVTKTLAVAGRQIKLAINFLRAFTEETLEGKKNAIRDALYETSFSALVKFLLEIIASEAGIEMGPSIAELSTPVQEYALEESLSALRNKIENFLNTIFEKIKKVASYAREWLSLLYKKLIEIAGGSSLILLVIDPQGRRVGGVLMNGEWTEVNEVPNAFYSGLGSQPQFVTIPNPTAKDLYTVTVVGNEPGEFHLNATVISCSHTVYQEVHIDTISQGEELNYTAEVKSILRSDINIDGVIDYKDLAILAASYGESEDESGYELAADLNNDGIIDYKDLAMLAADYGGGWS